MSVMIDTTELTERPKWGPPSWSLGVDIGSVTIKFVLLDEGGKVQYDSYARTEGSPVHALAAGSRQVREQLPKGSEIGAVGTTGSGRFLAGAFLGADVVKNEITAHAVGTLHWRPDIATIIEIGGQDSKIVHLRDGMVRDFAMNTVCAAGTGAFLDQQAFRLSIPIDEFGPFALTAASPLRIAGRCSVFAESDMIHYQQTGHEKADICMGLCQALVRNYLNNVARGKAIRGPVSFQGGVAFNRAILKCFQDALPGREIVTPPHSTGCGAIGAALLAREAVGEGRTKFRGWQEGDFRISQSTCPHCGNQCKICSLNGEQGALARWGGRCDRGNAL